ncbi:MAG TPA: hypothetical protein G4O01_00530 [Dehalococcoidia bacterium]|jgi:hypothetical protein|nr:hypothetical protein [Dehalococcoidia bacterium]
MEDHEIERNIRKSADTAISKMLSLAILTIEKETGKIIQHGKERIELKEKWLPKVQSVLRKVYENAVTEGSWWHKQS